MTFAVLHIEKGTAGKASGLGSHIDRTKRVLNADPLLSEKNFCLRYDAMYGRIRIHRSGSERNEAPLGERIQRRIEEGYKGKTAIRKDAVTHLNIVLTGSHDRMQDIASDPERLRNWAADNFRFVCNRYGHLNVVEFAVHMDERTPHIHCVVVPLTKDGRLSAKSVMGDRRAMSRLQDDYGKAMQEKYGLQRGIEGSTATHDSVREYYGRIKESLKVEPYKNPEIEVFPPRIGNPPLLNRQKWAEAQNKAISEAFFGMAREIFNGVTRTAENHVREAENSSIRKDEELNRLRKENAQYRGQDRRKHPERYSAFGKRLSKEDERFKAAILSGDLNELISLNAQGYQPSKQFFLEIARDKRSDGNAKTVANHLFKLDALPRLSNLKLATSTDSLSKGKENRQKQSGFKR